jgi:hypothetical protein
LRRVLSAFRDVRARVLRISGEEGNISTRDVKALIQWLYHRTVKFNTDNEEDNISAAIELAELVWLQT